MIPLFQPRVRDAVVDRVAATLRGGWLSEGKVVKSFEEEFSRHLKLPNALALNSGTAALHLALLAAGVKSGDEVITTTQTFVATAMSVLYVGAKPVFADIHRGGPNIDPADIERRITPRTRAIIVVHYGGYPCDMDEINAVAGAHRLPVIEDAAQAIGASYKGRSVGSLGDFSIFSFQAIKQLTTGDGGMLVCRDSEAYQQAYRQRWFGIDRRNRVPSELGQPEWDITEVGYKYHMNDIVAAMGLAQMEFLEEELARRRMLNARYRSEFGKIRGLDLIHEKTDRIGSCWLFTALVERRLDFVRAMKGRGIEAAVWHRRIDRNSLFGGLRSDLPNQADFDERQVSIPMRATLVDSEVDTILGALKSGW